VNFKSLFKQGVGTLIFRVIGAGLTFLSLLLFARVLGVYDFGLFSLGLVIVTVISIFTRLGLDNVVLKQVSAHIISKKEIANSYIYTASKVVIIIGLIVSVLLWYFAELISINVFNKPDLTAVLQNFALLIIPMSLVVIWSEVNKALGKSQFSAFTQVVVPPGITLMMVLYLWSVGTVSLSQLIISVAIGFLISLFIYLFSLRLNLTSDKSIVSYSSAIKQGLPMLMVSSGALVMAWSDIVILGIYASSEDVGVYTAASRTVMVTALILMAVNAVTAPKYARFYKDGDIASIAKLAQASSLVLLLVVLIPTLILVFFSEWVMSLFGPDYIEGASVLIVLAFGQFVNVACGSVGYLLTMTEREKKLRNIFFVAAILNVVLSILSVEYFGVIGVAYSTAFSVMLWNVWAMFEVRKHLGFWSINFNFRSYKELSSKESA